MSIFNVPVTSWRSRPSQWNSWQLATMVSRRGNFINLQVLCSCLKSFVVLEAKDSFSCIRGHPSVMQLTLVLNNIGQVSDSIEFDIFPDKYICLISYESLNQIDGFSNQSFQSRRNAQRRNLRRNIKNRGEIKGIVR